jgi:hypothetical protein
LATPNADTTVVRIGSVDGGGTWVVDRGGGAWVVDRDGGGGGVADVVEVAVAVCVAVAVSVAVWVAVTVAVTAGAAELVVGAAGPVVGLPAIDVPQAVSARAATTRMDALITLGRISRRGRWSRCC